MSGLSNLNLRLAYRGGDAEKRQEQDKLKSLRSAFSSYQSETAILQDGREFKCLINRDKDHMDYDNKILSIPYKDICLNYPNGEENIGLKPGDSFEWKETGTHWLIFLRHLTERAYFMAEIRRCKSQIEINGVKYWTYIRGPVETSIQWNQKSGIEWNDLNYSLVMYVPKNADTLSFFHRFKKVKVLDPVSGESHTWMVVGHNNYAGDGIIKVHLDEYFENTIEEEGKKEEAEKHPPIPPKPEHAPQIRGPIAVSKYDLVEYKILNCSTGGKWKIQDVENGTVVQINNTTEDSVELEILKSRGSFILQYKLDSLTLELPIQIEAL